MRSISTTASVRTEASTMWRRVFSVSSRMRTLSGHLPGPDCAVSSVCLRTLPKHDEKNHQFVIRCFEEIQRQIEKSNNRDALERLFYNRFAYVIVATAISGYFSPINPEQYADRKKSFKRYLKNRLVRETLDKCDRQQLGNQRKVILKLIDLKMWIVIQALAIVRYKQKH